MKLPSMMRFSMLALLFFVSACDKKNTDSLQTVIAGTNSKVWTATRQTDASGDKEKLSKEEKNETIQFYADGKYTMNGSTESANGTWTHDDAAKTLTLQPEGASVTETFQVVEMEDDEIELKAADGSQLKLETK